MPNGTEQPTAKGLDLNSLLPLLLLASPFLESKTPGLGLGLAAGVLQHQRSQEDQSQKLLLGMARDFANVPEEQKEVMRGLYRSVLPKRQHHLFDAAWSARLAFHDPMAAAERQMREITEGTVDGTTVRLPRGELERLRAQQAIRTRERTESLEEQQVREARGEARGLEAEQRQSRAQLVGQARTLTTQVLLNDATPPQARARARQLADAIAAGADPAPVVAELQSLAGQIGETAATTAQQTKQAAHAQKVRADLDKLADSGNPSAAGRIRTLARQIGEDPSTWLEELLLSAKERGLKTQALEAQIARARRGEGGATETNAALTLRLRRDYLAGKDIGPRGERLLFGAQGEEIIPVRDRQILQTWRQNLSPIDGTPIDPELDQKLRPVARQIIERMMQPSGPATVPPPIAPPAPRIPTTPQGQAPVPPLRRKTITRAEVDAIARRRGVHPNLIVQEANKQGYMVVDR